MSALRERMIGEMQVRRGALATQETHVRAIPPRKMLRYAASIAPAEKILRLGVQALSTDELLAAVLAEKAASEIAALAEGRLRNLAQMTARELLLLPGVGKRKAARLLAAMELGRRWAVEQKPATRKFRCGRDLFDCYHLALRDQKREHFICVLLDQKNRLVRDEVISVGGLTLCRVRIGEAFRSALRESAAAVAFVHNHPSGDPRPSQEDEFLTRRLASAAGLVGVRLLDHVIIGEERFYSFFDKGWL